MDALFVVFTNIGILLNSIQPGVATLMCPETGEIVTAPRDQAYAFFAGYKTPVFGFYADSYEYFVDQVN